LVTPQFDSTTNEQQGLLIALAMFGSRQHKELFVHLPQEEAYHLDKVIQPLLEIDRKRRIPLLVAELKRLLRHQAPTRLFSIDPTWLLTGLAAEPLFIRHLVLSAFPETLRKKILEQNSDVLSQTLPPKPVMSKETSSLVLKCFESKFAPMPYEEPKSKFDFQHIALLTGDEFAIFFRTAGLEQLAHAFAEFGIRKTANFLKHLPASVRDAIINDIRTISVVRKLNQPAILPFLRSVCAEFRDVEDLYQKAGLYFLACALSENESLLSRQIAQRLVMPTGEKLLSHVGQLTKEQSLILQRPSELQQRAIEVTLQLSKQGKIDKRFAQCAPLT